MDTIKAMGIYNYQVYLKGMKKSYQDKLFFIDKINNNVNRIIDFGCADETLLKYINDCVILKCKLIKIHPFRDGNGRAVRAFINLLFKLANIPPIYIENKEKYKYQEAMNNALCLGDYKDIIDFYYFKICDSIMALDVDAKNNVLYKDADQVTKVKQS